MVSDLGLPDAHACDGDQESCFLHKLILPVQVNPIDLEEAPDSDRTSEHPAPRIVISDMIAAAILLSNLLAPAYDPMAIAKGFKPTIQDLDLKDAKRNRTVPIRVYLPKTKAPAPVVLFSHGLGGARTNNAYLGNHFSARGYVVVFLQHPGSDESVWKGQRPREIMPAMTKAANGENYLLRIQDVSFVLDQLKTTDNGKIKGRFNLDKVGMSGHSFGAMTTQAVSGQSGPGIGTRYTDPRIDAAILYSPSSPNGFTPQQAFGAVKLPWLCMTGTNDTARVGNATPETRKAVYEALPPGDKYGLVLWEAEHSAFSERALPGESSKRNPNHHKVILSLSTAFWDAYLKDDASAKQWLKGSGAKSVLEPKDVWKTK